MSQTSGRVLRPLPWHAASSAAARVKMRMLRLRADGAGLLGSAQSHPVESAFSQVAPSNHSSTDLHDNARFARIVLPYLGDAYALARRMTGSRRDAEDVVQEACIRAFRAISRVNNVNFRAWVLTVVHNTACTWLRRNRRHAALVGVPDLAATELEHAIIGDVNAETPETVLIAKSDTERLDAAISALPPPFRETVILRDLDGLSYREIAEITGAPIGTVLSRVARGRKRLLASLLEEANFTHC
jgi:RNA polymerase sigma factor (sigma-70 family)